MLPIILAILTFNLRLRTTLLSSLSLHNKCISDDAELCVLISLSSIGEQIMVKMFSCLFLNSILTK